jgi:hypothetical protein
MLIGVSCCICCGDEALGKKLRVWIAHCISMVHFSILINRSLTEFFNSSHGLRLRILYYLYHLLLSWRLRILPATIDKEILSSFSVVSRNNEELLISHLFSADDTLIFCETNPDHLCYLFLCFEIVSGLKINLSKSELVFVGVVVDVGGLAHILICRVSSLPMKYLGLPLKVPYKAKSIWGGIC